MGKKRHRSQAQSHHPGWSQLVPLEPRDNALVDREHPPELWGNDRYLVIVERGESGLVACLSIRRRDNRPARDWRDFQRIKNQLAGPEVEAVELYPAQSRLVDTANQFFLWCMPPGQRLPIGFPEGLVIDADGHGPEWEGNQRRLEAVDVEGAPMPTTQAAALEQQARPDGLR